MGAKIISQERTITFEYNGKTYKYVYYGSGGASFYMIYDGTKIIYDTKDAKVCTSEGLEAYKSLKL